MAQDIDSMIAQLNGEPARQTKDVIQPSKVVYVCERASMERLRRQTDKQRVGVAKMRSEHLRGRREDVFPHSRLNRDPALAATKVN
jgi:hypothetical protein